MLKCFTDVEDPSKNRRISGSLEELVGVDDVNKIESYLWFISGLARNILTGWAWDYHEKAGYWISATVHCVHRAIFCMGLGMWVLIEMSSDIDWANI